MSSGVEWEKGEITQKDFFFYKERDFWMDDFYVLYTVYIVVGIKNSNPSF